MKWSALLLVIALAFNRDGSALQTLEPNGESPVQAPEQRKTAKVKAEVARRGVGEKSRVRVKLRNKLEFKGHITQIEEDSFLLQIDPDWLDADTSKDRSVMVRYEDVEKIRGPRSRAASIAIGVGLVVVLAAILVLEYDKYRRSQ